VLPRSNGRLSHAIRRHPLGRGSKAEHSRNHAWRSNQCSALVWRRASALFYFPVSAIGTPGILWVLRGSLDLICLSFPDLMKIPPAASMSKPTLHSRSLSIFISIEGFGLSFLVFTVFCLTSCTHSKDSAVSNQQTQAALHAETERAFALEARADVVIL
jgi:hypothetical protein